jgi:hypothetical protein
MQMPSKSSLGPPGLGINRGWKERQCMIDHVDLD